MNLAADDAILVIDVEVLELHAEHSEGIAAVEHDRQAVIVIPALRTRHASAFNGGPIFVDPSPELDDAANRRHTGCIEQGLGELQRSIDRRAWRTPIGGARISWRRPWQIQAIDQPPRQDDFWS